MANLILIFIALFIGLGLQRVKMMPKETHVSINVIILHVCLPALTLLSIPALSWEASLMSLCFVAWIIFGAAFVFFSWLGKRMLWSQSVIGCLILTAGLGNTAFVGFPIIEAAFGKESIKYAVLLDQPGTFLICSSLGIWVANIFSQGRIPKRELLKRVIVFPPFIGFTVAVILTMAGWRAEGIVQVLLQRFADMLAPLALISVGLQLKVREIRDDWHLLAWGLGFKLLVSPILIFGIYKLFGVPHEIFRVAVLEAAMAPMITSSIVAASYGLHPRLAGLMVGVGVPFSFLTLTIWYQFLS